MLHIYIVSLEQDVKRREIISKKLENLDLNFSFINAVYGKELSNETLNSIRSKSKGKILDRGFLASSGEVGCTLSHITAYENIICNNLSWACILEDDVILDKRFKIFISTFRDTLMDPKNLYILGGQNIFSEVHIIKSIKNNIIIGGQKFSKTIESEQFIYGACCYLVSYDLAKRLVQLFESSFILADDWNYLSEKNIISEIYLSRFVEHPSDLYASHLQEERELAGANKKTSNICKKISFTGRIKGSINWRLRVIKLRLYKYIEKKDIT